MIVEDNFFPESKQHPSTITVMEICERFVAAGLPCQIECHEDEVRIVFAGRKCSLTFTVNASGCPLTASMPDETDYDADIACILFEVFESIGWTYAPG